MAVKTSTATGNASAGGTWVGGVAPVTGDTVVVANTHTVTFDVPMDLGTSAAAGVSGAATADAITINASGVGIIAPGVTLTLRGDYGTTTRTVYGTALSMGEGSHILFDPPSGSAYQIYLNQRCLIAINGTSGARCSISTAVGAAAADRAAIASITSTSSGAMTATYCDFIRLGSPTTDAARFYCNHATATTYSFSDCTFTSCGAINPTVLGAVTDIIFDRCTFTNCTDLATANAINAHIIFDGANTTPTTGVRRIRKCYFDESAALYINMKAHAVEGNYFAGGKWQLPFPLANSAPTEYPGTFEGNLLNILGSGGNASAIPAGNANYFFGDPYYGGDGNFHSTQCATWPSATVKWQNNVHEHAGHSGDGEYAGPLAPGSAGSATIQYEYNLMMPTGVDVGTINGGIAASISSVITQEVRHNTNDIRGKHVYHGETVASRANMITSYEDNLVTAPGASASGYMVWDSTGPPATVTDAVTLASIRNNARYNLSAGFVGRPDYVNAANAYGGIWSGTPGTADLGAVDPGYVDRTRGFPAWHRDYYAPKLGLTAASAYANATAYSVGDVRSSVVSGYYGGRTIDYRCIVAHTSDATDPATCPPGTVGHSKQRIRMIFDSTGATGGAFTLKSYSLTTGLTSVSASIAYNASAATIASTLQTSLITAFGAGWTVSGSGGPINTTPVTLDIALAGTPTAVGWLTTDTNTITSGRHARVVCDQWRTNWEFAAYAPLRTAIPADTRVTDATLGLTNATYVDWVMACVKAGHAPTAAALRNAGHDSVTVGAVEGVFATGFTFTGPSGGVSGEASTNFTVTPTGGNYGGTATPSDGGAGGTFTPSSLTWASSLDQSAKTFTYTPASAGAKTISLANNWSLTAPSDITYTATSAGGGGSSSWEGLPFNPATTHVRIYRMSRRR